MYKYSRFGLMPLLYFFSQAHSTPKVKKIKGFSSFLLNFTNFFTIIRKDMNIFKGELFHEMG